MLPRRLLVVAVLALIPATAHRAAAATEPSVPELERYGLPVRAESCGRAVRASATAEEQRVAIESNGKRIVVRTHEEDLWMPSETFQVFGDGRAYAVAWFSRRELDAAETAALLTILDEAGADREPGTSPWKELDQMTSTLRQRRPDLLSPPACPHVEGPERAHTVKTRRMVLACALALLFAALCIVSPYFSATHRAKRLVRDTRTKGDGRGTHGP
jgi:hypothetical protein